MNRIVLIGNGFDLAHGLPTKYEDFINDYWTVFIKEAFNHVGGFEKEGVKLYLRRTKITLNEICNGSYPAGYHELNVCINNFDRKHPSDNGDTMSLKISNYLFKHICESKYFENWVDIENEYYKFLCYVFNKKKEHIEYSSEIELLNSDLKFIEVLLTKYLKKILNEFEIKRDEKIYNIIYGKYQLGELSGAGKNYSADDEYRKIKREKEGIIDNFSTRMSPKSETLLKLIDELSEKELRDIVSTLLSSNEDANKFFDFQPDNLLLLNFNYTDVLTHYITGNEIIDTEVINIHGEIKNERNPIIFGYGDELEENYQKIENLLDKNYLENIKSIKYLETDNYKKLLNFIESDKYQIIILGHSCGNSDRTLLNTLFEHENCVSIKPYYYQYKEGDVIKDNYSDIVRNISRCFTDKKSMRDKVVNKTYTDWFAREEGI